jgi:hypothetical protein
VADINGRAEYNHDGYAAKSSGLIKMATRIATIREQRSFRHLQRLWGLICRVYFPVSGEYDPHTRTGSLYNREDNKFNYNNIPDIENANMVFSNLMDLTRYDAVTRMDALGMRGDIYAFTNLEKDGKCAIPVNSKIVVEYNYKESVFFVWAIPALDSPHEEDGKAIYKLELKAHL